MTKYLAAARRKQYFILKKPRMRTGSKLATVYHLLLFKIAQLSHRLNSKYSLIHNGQPDVAHHGYSLANWVQQQLNPTSGLSGNVHTLLDQPQARSLKKISEAWPEMYRNFKRVTDKGVDDGINKWMERKCHSYINAHSLRVIFFV